MKTLLRSKFMVALAGVFLTLYAQTAAAPFVQPDLGGAVASQYVPGEVLVKFKPEAIAQERAATVAALGHTILAHLEQPGWTHVKLGVGQSVSEALALYESDPNVEAAQPNYIYRAAVVPNDPRYGQLWAFKNTGQTITNAFTQPPSSAVFPTDNPGVPGDDMNIEKAWDHITDCSGIVVAVVDSGVNYNQEDLIGNMWNGSAAGFPNHGTDFVDADIDPMDLEGHGTHVAGIIGAAGNNATGSAGVCWKASIMAVRVLDALGVGTTVTLSQGINFAVTHGAKVINMSIGGIAASDPILSGAITNAQNSDVVVIVAAGNEAANNDDVATPTFPCNFAQPNLVCVAALDQGYQLASFSNFGATSVDVGAPGTNILSAWSGGSATTADNLNVGGAGNWTSSAGWVHKLLTLASGPTVDSLVNPSTFPAGTYAINQDNRVFKSFNLGGANAAVLNFSAQMSIETGDSLNLNYRTGGGDPFAAGGVQLDGGSGVTGGIVPFSYDLTPCISATCSVGFQLVSDATAVAAQGGAAIIRFSIDTLTINTNSYNTISGTSMATPEVAGLAAMLRAYNPQFTFADTVSAIKKGGRSVAALAGKTTTGKAIDVMSSLAYVNAPAGLTATVQ
jgi:subtilisin family serine protease